MKENKAEKGRHNTSSKKMRRRSTVMSLNVRNMDLFGKAPTVACMD